MRIDDDLDTSRCNNDVFKCVHFGLKSASKKINRSKKSNKHLEIIQLQKNIQILSLYDYLVGK